MARAFLLLVSSTCLSSPQFQPRFSYDSGVQTEKLQVGAGDVWQYLKTFLVVTTEMITGMQLVRGHQCCPNPTGQPHPQQIIIQPQVL